MKKLLLPSQQIPAHSPSKQPNPFGTNNIIFIALIPTYSQRYEILFN
ncbi:MAG: hypothetical protein ABI415_09255 [Flavitalea sp.]